MMTISRPRSARRIHSVATLSIALFAGSCENGPVEEKGPGLPAQMEVVAGQGQEGVVGQELPNALLLKITDAEDRAVPGQLVTFVVISGGGSLFVPAGITDANGRVQNRWTLGTRTADVQKVEARAIDNATGERLVFAEFTATAKPDAAAALEKIAAGDGQEGVVGTQLAQPFTVRVIDRYDNPVPGANVAWTATAGGGALDVTSSLADASGVASARLTLGSVAGVNAVSASVGTVATVDFSAVGKAAAVAGLVLVSGDAQQGVVGSALPSSFVVRLTDAHGNPVTGATITWTVYAGGGTIAPSGTTDTDGRASARLTLGTGVGNNTAHATADGLLPVEFNATSVAGPPATYTRVSGHGQVGVWNRPLPEPLVMRILDRYGNPAVGAVAEWGVSTPGTAVNPATSPADEEGLARTMLTPGLIGEARAWGVVHDASFGIAHFTATGISPVPAGTSISAGDGQRATVGTRLPAALVIRAVDAQGNGVDGVQITWAATPIAGGGHGTISALKSLTDADGYASITWTLGTLAGVQQATASIPSGTSTPTRLTFSANAMPDSPAKFLKLRGDDQPGMPAATLPLPLVVGILDRFDNPVPGVEVTFVAEVGGGSVAPTSALTDAKGEASTWFTLGTANGNAATASAGGLPPVTFHSRPTSFSSVSVGGNACGVTGDGGLFCWGFNRYGEMGTGTSDLGHYTRPAPAGGQLLFRSIDVGEGGFNYEAGTVCGVTLSNEAYCWGGNRSNQAGTAGTVACAWGPCVPTPVRIGGGSITFAVVRVGTGHTCGLTLAGEAYCWGRGATGALGDGPTTATPFPVAVSGGHTFTDIGAGSEFSCGLTTARAIYCWGSTAGGRLGTTVAGETSKPVPIASSESFTSLSVGDQMSCAIAASGPTYCWGYNTFGQLGNGTDNQSVPWSAVPVMVAGGHAFSTVTTSGLHACGLTAAGEAFCWGFNSFKELGIGPSTQDHFNTPQQVVGNLTFSSIHAGGRTTCGIAIDGRSYCWGRNVGDWATQVRDVPTLVKTGF